MFAMLKPPSEAVSHAVLSTSTRSVLRNDWTRTTNLFIDQFASGFAERFLKLVLALSLSERDLAHRVAHAVLRNLRTRVEGKTINFWLKDATAFIPV